MTILYLISITFHTKVLKKKNKKRRYFCVLRMARDFVFWCLVIELEITMKLRIVLIITMMKLTSITSMMKITITALTLAARNVISQFAKSLPFALHVRHAMRVLHQIISTKQIKLEKMKDTSTRSNTKNKKDKRNKMKLIFTSHHCSTCPPYRLVSAP